jgi:lipopolysaccharide/colanic/teichoic acid biosynthesis glycosyltransferase
MPETALIVPKTSLMTRARPLSLTTKRLIDVIGAAAALIMMAPLLLLIACLLLLFERGPILFRQVRVGRGGRRFMCLKFRTMIIDAEEALEKYLTTNMDARREWEASQKLKKDPRITPLGHFLRRTSLDELPQLLNVLGGQMSLVGPRPIVPDEIARYGDQLEAYLSVRPGITGLWQVSGRNDCNYNERVQLDARYVSEWRLYRDLIILLRTVPAVLRQRGSC